MESAREIVAQYFAAFDAHRDGWKDLVTEGVERVSPLQSARGKEPFIAPSERFRRLLRETRVLRRFEDGSARLAKAFGIPA